MSGWLSHFKSYYNLINNALMQNHFNSTNFINAARIFSLTRDLTRSWGKGYAQCCQFSNIADPFSKHFPSKKRSNLIFVSENRRYWCARSCCPSPCTPLSLSLSLSLSLPAQVLFSEWRRGAALSVKHRYDVASLIIHAGIAEITAYLSSILCVFDFIKRLLDYQDFCAD